MDEQILAKLEKIESQTKENNEILRKLYTFQKRKIIITVVYWGVIILIAFGAFYFVRPMIEGIFGTYTGVIDEVVPKNDLQSLKELQDFLKE